MFHFPSPHSCDHPVATAFFDIQAELLLFYLTPLPSCLCTAFAFCLRLSAANQWSGAFLKDQRTIKAMCCPGTLQARTCSAHGPPTPHPSSAEIYKFSSSEYFLSIFCGSNPWWQCAFRKRIENLFDIVQIYLYGYQFLVLLSTRGLHRCPMVLLR